MAKPVLDSDRFAIIGECTDPSEIGDEDAEWPNNNLSRHVVVYNDGTIARRDDQVNHEIDEEELALCVALSLEAQRLLGDDISVAGSESGQPYRDFFIAAPLGAAAPLEITETLIVERFANTLSPLLTFTVEPFEEQTIWWEEVLQDADGCEPSYLDPWRDTFTWFVQQPAFVTTAFVRIGDSRHLMDIPRSYYPPGTVMPGALVMRLAVGLTQKGSLVGLFGHSVQT